jgi:hypothetical protein
MGGNRSHDLSGNPAAQLSYPKSLLIGVAGALAFLIGTRGNLIRRTSRSVNRKVARRICRRNLSGGRNLAEGAARRLPYRDPMEGLEGYLLANREPDIRRPASGNICGRRILWSPRAVSSRDSIGLVLYRSIAH